MTGRPVIASKMPSKSACWNGRSRSSAARRPASVSARIISCITGSRSSPKNMCSVRQRPMPCAPNSRARAASGGVSAFARTRSRRNPSAQPSTVWKSSFSEGGTSSTAPRIDGAAAAVDRDHVTFAQLVPAEGRDAALERQPVAARDARLPHPPRHHRCVRGHPSVHRQDPLRGDHPVDVVRRRLVADEDHRAALRPLDRRVGFEDDAAARRAGARVQPLARPASRRRVRVDRRMEELVELGGIDARRPRPRA